MSLANFIDVDFSSITGALNAIINYINQKTLTKITASGAVPVISGGDYIITDAGVAVLTLAAPIVTTQDGMMVNISSVTAEAHTLTATGLLFTGAAAVNEATFAAQKGAGLSLMAYQGSWIVKYSAGITFS